MKRNVCLVIIFNHRYDANLQKLRDIYGSRFHTIRFLMPFYNGDDPDVISVFESSYQFQGYLIQAYKELTELGCHYYVFIGDDLILAPELDEDSIIHEVSLDKHKVVCTGIEPVNHENGFGWSHARFSPRAFYHRSTRWLDSLLPIKDAEERFREFFGDGFNRYYSDGFFNGRLPGESEEAHQRSMGAFLRLNHETREMPYPIAMGYSDFFCISSNKLYEIAYYCGVFSAMNLFCEIALPTAIVLTTKREDVLSLSDLNDRSHLAIWGDDERKAFDAKYDSSYLKLKEEWPEKCLYIHPVKLSHWEVSL